MFSTKGNKRIRKVVGKVEAFRQELVQGEEEALTQKVSNQASLARLRALLDSLIARLNMIFEKKQQKIAAENAVIDADVADGRKLLALLNREL